MEDKQNQTNNVDETTQENNVTETIEETETNEINQTNHETESNDMSDLSERHTTSPVGKKPIKPSSIIVMVIIALLIITIIVMTVMVLTKDGKDDAKETQPQVTEGKSDVIVREDPVALKINNIDIKKSEYLIMRTSAASNIINTNVKFAEDATDEENNAQIIEYINGDDEGKTFWDKVDEQAIEDAKTYSALRNMTIEQEIVLTAEERQEFDSYQDQQYMVQYFEDVDEIFLQTFGVTKTELYDYNSYRYAADKAQQKIIENSTYDDAILKKTYDDNKKSFSFWDVRHVLISTEAPAPTIDPAQTVDPSATQAPTPTLSPEDKKTKKELAEEILAKINNGEDMVKLVTEYSEDPGKTSNDGLYQVTPDANFIPEFLEWSINAKKGDTGVVETDFGYHVMKCEEDNSFESRKDFVKMFHGYKDIESKIQESIKDDKYNAEIVEEVVNDLDMSFYMGNFQ